MLRICEDIFLKTRIEYTKYFHHVIFTEGEKRGIVDAEKDDVYG